MAPPHALGPRNKRGTKETVPLALALMYCERTYLPCLSSWEGLDLLKLGTKANPSSLKMFAQGNFGLSDRGGEKNTNTDARVAIKGNLGEGNAAHMASGRTVTVLTVVFFTVIPIS